MRVDSDACIQGKRIAFVFTPSDLTPNKEFVGDSQVRLMASIAERSGWNARVYEYAPDTVDQLTLFRPDVVFNLAYGYSDPNGNHVESQPATAQRLEALGLNCIGSTAAVQHLVQDKLRTAELLETMGVRSPKIYAPSDWASSSGYRILKPRYGSCHRGVVLISPSEMAVLENRSEEYLLQDYVDGVECTVGVLQVNERIQVLKPIFIAFEVTGSDKPILVAEKHTWQYETRQCDDQRLLTTAANIFSRLGLRDYCRIDFRIDNRGPIVLDVNALPNLDPNISLFPKSAIGVGLTYEQVVETLLQNAYMRSHRFVAD
jgi:D-alanine-D-alanine ligase